MLVFVQNSKHQSTKSIHGVFYLETAALAVTQYDCRLPGHAFESNNGFDF